MRTRYPERIICLTEETTEFIYMLGADDRIVGISGFTVRPPEARKTKPKVSTFLEANYDLIESLKPDIIFSYSDLQANITGELIKRGFAVVNFNQRSVKEIFSSMLMIGSILGLNNKAEEIVNGFEKKIEAAATLSSKLKINPKVYFEEWDEPMISCIRWVSELIEIAGGEEIFKELRSCKSAKDRIVSGEEVIKRNPDIIIGSWCGKGFKKNKVINREGWSQINAIKNKKLFEIKSSIILQPGPAAINEGLDALLKIIHDFK